MWGMPQSSRMTVTLRATLPASGTVRSAPLGVQAARTVAKTRTRRRMVLPPSLAKLEGERNSWRLGRGPSGQLFDLNRSRASLSVRELRDRWILDLSIAFAAFRTLLQKSTLFAVSREREGSLEMLLRDPQVAAA